MISIRRMIGSRAYDVGVPAIFFDVQLRVFLQGHVVESTRGKFPSSCILNESVSSLHYQVE